MNMDVSHVINPITSNNEFKSKKFEAQWWEEREKRIVM